MHSRISIGNKMELIKIESKLSANPDKQPQKYLSKVLDEAPEGRFYASMPMKSGRIVPLNVGEQFDATIYADSGLMHCKLEITARYKKGSLFLMEVEMLSDLEKVQRRQYFRLESRKPIKYRILKDEELDKVRAGEIYMADDFKPEWTQAIMIDLSGGGMRFVSEVKEDVGSLIELELEVVIGEAVEVLYIYAELLRCEYNNNNPSILDHRVMFWKIDNAIREKIVRFIFDEQRKRIQSK